MTYQSGTGFKSTNQKGNIPWIIKSEYIIDETAIKSGSELIWIWWINIEPKNKETLADYLSKKRNVSIAKRFLPHVINKYGKHQVSSDGGTRYPQALGFLKLNHHLQSSYEKSLIERTIKYIKDRTEGFDNYFPCRKKNKCQLKHIKQ